MGKMSDAHISMSEELGYDATDEEKEKWFNEYVRKQMIPKPRYQHNHKSHIFLGAYKRYDLYYVPDATEPFLARFGDEIGATLQGQSTNGSQPLATAYQRAKKKRLF